MSDATIHQKFVEFDKYCPKCKHKEKAEVEDPCWDCLTYPVNDGSIKPLYFEEAKK